MKIVLAVVAVACALTLGGCKGIGALADNKDLVCSAAKAWIDADPSAKKKMSGELSSAIKKAESSSKDNKENSSTTQNVLAAAKKLVSGNGSQVTEAAAKIQKYC